MEILLIIGLGDWFFGVVPAGELVGEGKVVAGLGKGVGGGESGEGDEGEGEEPR